VNKLIGIVASVGSDERKIVEYLGPELVPGGWWLSGYWGVFEANWTEGALSLISDGTNGFLVKGTFWEVGKSYRVTFAADRVAGTIYGPFINTPGGSLSVTGTITYDYIPLTTSMSIYSSGFDGALTALSVKKILKREEDE